jgi:hypothetical protein
MERLWDRGSYVINSLGDGWFQVIVRHEKSPLDPTPRQVTTIHAIDKAGLDHVVGFLQKGTVLELDLDFLQKHSREPLFPSLALTT